MPNPDTFSSKDIEFDEHGNLTILNKDLGRRILAALTDHRGVRVKLQPWPVEPVDPDGVCGIGPKPLPNLLCVCTVEKRGPIYPREIVAPASDAADAGPADPAAPSDPAY